MQTLNRQRSNRVEVWRYAFKIGGQQFHLSWARRKRVCTRPATPAAVPVPTRVHQSVPSMPRFASSASALINRQNVVQRTQAIRLFTFHFTSHR